MLFRSGPSIVFNYDYKYNGKEYQDELGLNLYDYGARNYDPAIGRWMNMDNFSEDYYDFSNYAYVGNMPTIAIDPDGNLIIFVIAGKNPGEKPKALTYQNGNAYWLKENGTLGEKYNWKGANYSIARVIKSYQKIEKSNNKQLKHMLHTLEKSKNVHYINETQLEDGSSVYGKGIGDPFKGERLGSEAWFDFSKETQEIWKSQNDNIEISEFGEVVHEMQHQYDYDIGNMADDTGKHDAKNPVEKRAVATENIAREMEHKEPRTKYGGVTIEWDVPDGAKERNNN